MLTIKISDEVQEKLGISTAEQALSLLSNYKAGSIETAASVGALTSRIADLETKFEALGLRCKESLDKIAAMPKPIDEAALIEKVKAEAKIVASGEVSAAIAKSGGAALATKDTPPANPGEGNKPADFKTLVKAQVAAGKSSTEAIRQSISQHPDLYKQWAQQGGSLN